VAAAAGQEVEVVGPANIPSMQATGER